MACTKQCMPNASRDALIREALEVAVTKQTQARKSCEAQLLAARADLVKASTGKRWLWRAKMDAQARVKELEKKLADASKTHGQLQTDIEVIEEGFSKALASSSRLTGHKLISSSLHSVMASKRKAAVLMTVDNAEECLRQHLRAELGLQDAPILLTPGDVCDECGIQMVVVSHDSMLSCTRCHKLRILPNTMTVSAMHGTDVESASSITKHRLPEWIEMAQAKEFGEASPEAIERVALYILKSGTGLEQYKDMIKEERKKGPFKDAEDAIRRLDIPDLEKILKSITAAEARASLHALVNEGDESLRKFYERSAKIAASIGGYWPPRMNSQQEEKLRMLYTIAAPVYEKRRKPKQSFFPGGFPFFLRSLVLLLGFDEFAESFPVPGNVLGTRDTLRADIWKELGWELVPISGKMSPIRLPDGSVMQIELGEETVAIVAEPQKKRKRKDAVTNWACS